MSAQRVCAQPVQARDQPLRARTVLAEQLWADLVCARPRLRAGTMRPAHLRQAR